jgi:hypothetical protein
MKPRLFRLFKRKNRNPAATEKIWNMIIIIRPVEYVAQPGIAKLVKNRTKKTLNKSKTNRSVMLKTNIIMRVPTMSPKTEMELKPCVTRFTKFILLLPNRR